MDKTEKHVDTATGTGGAEHTDEGAPGIAGAQKKGTTRTKEAGRRAQGRRKPRTRASRPYPASSFSEALPLAEAIHRYASGQRVRRLTLLKQMDKRPTSSSTQMLITNSGKYGITTGSYAAEWLSLTDTGSLASYPGPLTKRKFKAQFQLAIEGIVPFSALYTEYRGKRLPNHEVMKDLLKDHNIPDEHLQECVDTFVVNAKDMNLIQTIAGSEMLLPVEQVVDELPEEQIPGAQALAQVSPAAAEAEAERALQPEKTEWSAICFVITAIAEEGSEQRKHSDLMLNSLIEPALKEFNLRVVRADKIGSAGMITSQVLEHVMRSRLAVVDLSFHNPNAFYEMAIRHACALPVVQITRKIDKPPFDVNQVRTVIIDTTDVYTLVPKLETYRSEIATQVRAALADEKTGNPITVFFPGVKVTIPAGK
jgi:hypothetical protein